MQFKEVIASNVEEAFAIAKEKYGLNIFYEPKSAKPVKKKHFWDKKQYVYTFSMYDEDYRKLKDLQNKQEVLGITGHDKTNEILSQINQIKTNSKPKIEPSKTVSDILGNAEIKKLNDNLEFLTKQLKNSGMVTDQQENIHPNILHVQKILKENEFYDDFIKEVVDTISDKLTLNELEDSERVDEFVYDYIKAKLKITPFYKPHDGDQTILALIGPTGIGKTTTIAKIAGQLVKNQISIKIISIDGFKIGGKEQLDRYAKILKADCAYADNAEELQSELAKTQSKYILIDTAGRSHNDEMNIVTMKTLLKSSRFNIRYLLVISATTKARDVKKIFKAFDTFDYDGVVITKVDESDTIGAILSEAMMRDKGVSFYTNGQNALRDIVKASHENILQLVNGLQYISLKQMQS